MVVVVVQVGQAGNQVGAALWQLLIGASKQPTAGPRERPGSAPTRIPRELSGLLRWGHDGTPRARAVLIDTEPKAVRAAMRGAAGDLLDPERCVLGHSGCANNWAYGYLVQQSPREREQQSRGKLGDHETILSAAMQAIRAEVECCTGMVEFLLVHSIAGGSGSGLGSRILEGLRERYPLAYIVSASVVPSLGGDTPTQSLNACLTLQWLQAYADGILLFRNDALVSSITSNSGGGGGGADAVPVTLERINMQIARCLAGLLLPTDPVEPGPMRSCHLPLKQLVLHACPDPEMKFLEVYHAGAVPSASTGRSTWADLARNAGAAAGRFDSLDGNRPAHSSGTLAVARGSSGPPSPSSSSVPPLQELRKAISRAPALACVDWRDDDPVLVLHSKSCPGCLAGRRASASNAAPGGTPALGSNGANARALTLASNRSTVVGLLRHLSTRAMQLCEAGAYMHWYERHGCSREAVAEAARSVREVADVYAHWFQMHHHLPDGADHVQQPRK